MALNWGSWKYHIVCRNRSKQCRLWKAFRRIAYFDSSAFSHGVEEAVLLGRRRASEAEMPERESV